MRPTAEELETYRSGLAALGYDGPIEIETGDVMAMAFGAAQSYAVCLRCGAMVMLGDPLEVPEQSGPVERGLMLHSRWHNQYPAEVLS